MISLCLSVFLLFHFKIVRVLVSNRHTEESFLDLTIFAEVGLDLTVRRYIITVRFYLNNLIW